MLGLNNYVIVIVINALSTNKKPTNYFTTTKNTVVAALNSISDSMGNQHARTNIQKQAFTPSQVSSVRAAFGITGTNFGTHSAYINGKKMNLNSTVVNKTEIVLIKNGLNVKEALKIANKHRIIPERTNPIIPSNLGEVLDPDEVNIEIKYEVLGTDEDPGPTFGPGNAGQPGGYGDFGGE